MSVLTLPSFRVNDSIYESPRTSVLKGVREADGLPVVLKLLKDEHLSSHDLAQYLQEYEIVKGLQDLPGVIRAYGVEKVQEGVVIVFEDFGGSDLKQLIPGKGCDLEQIVALAIEVVSCLGAIHAAHAKAAQVERLCGDSYRSYFH